MDKVKRTQVGLVISDKMDKTIVVKIDSIRRHNKYHKSYKVFKKFKVHDENNEYKTGDKVEFIESKPLSKDKHYVAVRKV
jgi:small subunit ribosomal protein S17